MSPEDLESLIELFDEWTQVNDDNLTDRDYDVVEAVRQLIRESMQ